MNSQFKKLFDIHYNEKTFTIFVDEYHRCTFLEKTKDEKYIYPTLEDFIALNKIYNEHDPFVFCHAKKYSFKEKVKVGAMLVAVPVVLPVSAITAKENNSTNWEVSQEDDMLNVNQKDDTSSEEIFISDLNDLETVFGISSVTLKDIDQAIEDNNKLDVTFKKLAHNLALGIYESEPNVDLRVYYLNLRDDLEAIAMSGEEYEATFHDSSVACYDAVKNKIFYKIGCSEPTLYHELGHTVSILWRKIDNKIYRHSARNNYGIDEAMNNKVVEFVTPSTAYENIGMVLDYLLTFVDYDLNRYLEEGPIYIVDELLKYPGLDAFYIRDCLNGMQDSSAKLGENKTVQECTDLLDELFKLCKTKVDTNMQDIYGPFLEFSKLITSDGELFDHYLKEYNACLKENGILNRMDENYLTSYLSSYKEVKGFMWKEETLDPYIEKDKLTTLVIHDGKEKEVSNIGGVYFQSDTFYLLLKRAMLQNPEMEIKDDFWKEFAVKNEIIGATYLYKTKVMLNGKILREDYLENLKIQIGRTETNQIGFILTDGYQEIFYQSAENLKNLSNNIVLSNYCEEYLDTIEKLELSSILNDTYLKKVQEKEKMFQNLFIEENKLRLEPYYWLYLETQNEAVVGVDLNHCLIYPTEEKLKASRTYILMPIFLEEPIYLKEVLNYYALLEEDGVMYSFSQEEILNLVANYVEEKNYKQSR